MQSAEITSYFWLKIGRRHVLCILPWHKTPIHDSVHTGMYTVHDSLFKTSKHVFNYTMLHVLSIMLATLKTCVSEMILCLVFS